MSVTDRYLKFILTVIALELIWIGLRDGGANLAAQATPTRVIITGVEMDGENGGVLPVAIAGTRKEIPARYRKELEPAIVRVVGSVAIDSSNAVRIEAIRPIKVETERPLKVESVPYTPGSRPGD